MKNTLIVIFLFAILLQFTQQSLVSSLRRRKHHKAQTIKSLHKKVHHKGTDKKDLSIKMDSQFLNKVFMSGVNKLQAEYKADKKGFLEQMNSKTMGQEFGDVDNRIIGKITQIRFNNVDLSKCTVTSTTQSGFVNLAFKGIDISVIYRKDFRELYLPLQEFNQLNVKGVSFNIDLRVDGKTASAQNFQFKFENGQLFKIQDPDSSGNWLAGAIMSVQNAITNNDLTQFICNNIIETLANQYAPPYFVDKLNQFMPDDADLPGFKGVKLQLQYGSGMTFGSEGSNIVLNMGLNLVKAARFHKKSNKAQKTNTKHKNTLIMKIKNVRRRRFAQKLLRKSKLRMMSKQLRIQRSQARLQKSHRRRMASDAASEAASVALQTQLSSAFIQQACSELIPKLDFKTMMQTFVAQLSINVKVATLDKFRVNRFEFPQVSCKLSNSNDSKGFKLDLSITNVSGQITFAQSGSDKTYDISIQSLGFSLNVDNNGGKAKSSIDPKSVQVQVTMTNVGGGIIDKGLAAGIQLGINQFLPGKISSQSTCDLLDNGINESISTVVPISHPSLDKTISLGIARLPQFDGNMFGVEINADMV